LFARDREQRDLVNLLIAERIVLLHAPSGAGKTSLIQAGLIPRLQEGRRFHPTPAARVKTPPPRGVEVHNRYIFSVALDLLDGARDPKELAGITFAEIIAELTPPADEGYLVLILDQFEEILSIDPTDWKNQTVFFRELGAVLQNGGLWTLISMREDYMGGLDRFLRYLPGQLQTTFRLDYLSRKAAKVAIQEPARKLEVDFADDAAAELVARLAKVSVARPGEAVKEVDAPYVQPFQLQVVCRSLWEAMAHMPGNDFTAIELRHVQDHVHIPEALADYYAGAVAEVASEKKVDEGAIRRWFEQRLITKNRLRIQALEGPETGQADPEAVLLALEETRLIRKDTRGDSTWWELSHDTLISAVLDDNLKWFSGRLKPWQLAARAWAQDRKPGRLLTGPELRAAQHHARSLDLTDEERRFLEESERVEKDRGTLTRMRSAVASLWTVVILQGVAILVLLFVLITR
jgi:Novel STAND NTPase 1